MSEHVHEDAYHDSDYSQVCACGAVRLRQSGRKEWEPWHACALCCLSPGHETAPIHERQAAYDKGKSDARAGRGLYYSGSYTPDYLAGAASVKDEVRS